MEGLSPEFSNLVETIIYHIGANPRDWSWDRVVAFMLEGEARTARHSFLKAYVGASGSGAKRKESRTCFFCGKLGHLKTDCRKFKRASEKQGGTVDAALASTSSAAAAANVVGSWWMHRPHDGR
jgi:hypothetical protein